VAFYLGECKLEGGYSKEVDTVEMRLRGFKSDQGRNEAVLMGHKGG